jgi:hypothetical protein
MILAAGPGHPTSSAEVIEGTNPDHRVLRLRKARCC